MPVKNIVYCSFAGLNGKLDCIIIYAIENGLLWNETTCLQEMNILAAMKLLRMNIVVYAKE